MKLVVKVHFVDAPAWLNVAIKTRLDALIDAVSKSTEGATQICS